MAECTKIDDINDYFVLDRILGTGGFGKVSLAKVTNLGKNLIFNKLALEPEPEQVAIKEISTYHVKLIIEEIYFLSKLKFKHSIQYYGCFETKDNLYLIMEYYNGVELFDLIVAGSLSITQKNKIAKDLAFAINELHEHSIVHRDLKPENIMVNTNTYDIKLIDYGFSCDLTTRRGECEDLRVGSLTYFDNTSFNEKNYDLKIYDWWAYGQILVILYLSKTLFNRERGYNVYTPLTTVEIESLPIQIQKFIARLTDPRLRGKERPGPDKILEYVSALPTQGQPAER